MRQFNPFFTFTLLVHAIKKSTEQAILVQYKKNDKEKNYIWFPRGWLYNIKYKKIKNNDNAWSTRITLVFHGFLENEIRMKISHLDKKSKKK